MAFEFSLAAVLRYRQGLEQSARLRLRSLHARRVALTREVEQTHDARMHLETSARRQLRSRLIPAVELQYLAASCDTLGRRQQQLQAALLQLQDEITVQARRYQEERRQREALESLRDLRFSEYRLQQQRRQQAALDELFLLRRKQV